MVGFECKAEWFDKEHMPDFVKPKQTFWSKRPPIENSIGFIVAEVLMWFIWVKICMHELCSIYSGMTCKADIGPHLYKNGRSYLLFLVSFISPLLCKIFSRLIPISTQLTWVSFNQLALAIRVFSEGKVLKPFYLIVSTIETASSHLMNVCFVVIFMASVTTFVHGQLFGVIDSNLHSANFMTTGLATTFNLLVSIPGVQEDWYVQSEAGTLLLWYMHNFGQHLSAHLLELPILLTVYRVASLIRYWGVVLMRLTFGSFTIAVLVGSFNKVRAEVEKSEAREHAQKDKQRRLRVPLSHLPGLTAAPQRRQRRLSRDLHASFDAIDLNKDGTLQKAELAEALKSIGKDQHQVDKMLSTVSDKETVDFDTFKGLARWMQKRTLMLVWGSELVWYLLCWRTCSAFAPRLQRRLLRMSRDAKMAFDGDVMFTRNELTVRLSAKATEELLTQATHIKHQHTYNMQHMQYATCSQECNSYEAVYYTKYITTRSCCITMYMQHTCSNTYAPYNEHL